MRALVVALSVTFLLGTFPASRAQAANLLVNGSFETWSGGYAPSNQPDRIFNDGSLSVPGWNFAIGLSSDLYRDRNASGAQSAYYDAADGNYLAASGSFDTLHEGISQTFAVAPGTQYAVTFQMAPGGLNYSGSWIENASVSSSWRVQVTGDVIGAVDQTFITSLADFNASGTTNPLRWTPQLLTFTSNAAGGNVTLLFTAYGDRTHVFLDSVVVKPYEPVSLPPCPETHVITGDVTCDNYFAIYTAPYEAVGMPITFAGVMDCHPHARAVAINTTDRYLYIACSGDQAVAQGLMHDLNIDGTDMFSGDHRWQVTYTDNPLSIGCGPTPPSGLAAAMRTVIPAPPGGWVTPAVGCLNPPPTGESCYGRWFNFPTIDLTARRTWYDSGNQVSADAPFYPGFNHREFLIFRLDMCAGKVACRDSLPPDPATLTVSCSQDSLSNVIHWIAPSDPTIAFDAGSGACAQGVRSAASYDMRWSNAPIVTTADFDAANQVQGEPIPSPPGTAESFTLPVTRAAGVYVALRSNDQGGNTSDITSVLAECWTWIGVGDSPAPAFGLAGVIPNPTTSGRMAVEFFLPDGAPARLELVDVAGRMVAVRDVGSLGAGRHVVDLGAGRKLQAGVYLVRLTQGSLHRSTRAIVLR